MLIDVHVVLPSFPPTGIPCACDDTYMCVCLCADVPPPSSPPTPTPSHGTTPTVAPATESLSAGILSAVIIVLVVAMLCVLVGIFLGCCYIKKHQKKKLILLHNRQAYLKR